MFCKGEPILYSMGRSGTYPSGFSGRETGMNSPVPFHRPSIGKEEEQAVVTALRAGALGGNGPITRRLQQHLADWLGVRQVLLTTSCTTALEMAMMLLGLKPGDEVILPSYSFVSTANAIIRAGGRPVFADIDPDTYNLDVEAVEQAVSPRTRAVLLIHYGGQGCDMDRFQALAATHQLSLVEDAAQAFGARYNACLLGTLGQMGAYSFHVTKNVVCGEGGAFVTDDEAIARRAEIIWEKGTNRSAFLRGEVDKYSWFDVGGSFVLSDLLAAVVEVQVQKLDTIIALRRQRWERYEKELGPLAAAGKIRLHRVEVPSEYNYHLFAFRTLAVPQAALIQELRRRGVEATFHFIPLHTSPYGRKHFPDQPALPHTDGVAASLVRLPLYPDLSVENHDRVVEAMYEVFKGD